MAESKSRRSAEASLNTQRRLKWSDPAALPQLLSSFLASRVQAGERLCVGLSGGRDSVVLLHALRALTAVGNLQGIQLSALHVHHGLSANADAWADFCSALCRAWDVPLSIERVKVPRDCGSGLEAAARRLRHAAFAACGADWIALAHHRDDQAETVLLNLLRGAGVDGARGMPAERLCNEADSSGARLIRPLLDAPRSLLDAYAAQHALRWIDDESNADTDFRRNFLRHDIMPRLTTHFPGSTAALARAATHFGDAAELLMELAEQDRQTLAPQGRIVIDKLNALAKQSPARARNLLRYELRRAAYGMPETRWIDEALKQLANVRADGATCIGFGQHESHVALHVYRGELHLIAPHPAAPEQAVHWQGEEALPWAGGKVRFIAQHGAGLSRAWLAENAADLRIARRSGRERLQLDAKRPRRTLKNLLQEAAIPPWERDRLPVLWCGETVVWVGGIGVDCRFACAPDEAGIAVAWDSAERAVDTD